MLCTFTEFKPARLFAVTGMSPSLQQVWRKRGQLPWGSGDPRPITALEAAEVFIRYQLALVGAPPSESNEVGRETAPIIVWHALLNVAGSCLVRGGPKRVADFLNDFENAHGFITDITGVTAEDAFRYLFRFNGAGTFIKSHQRLDLIDGVSALTTLCVDLDALGTKLGTLANGPMITVDLPDHKIPKSEWITASTGASKRG